jgi:hypothetical protein
MARAAVRRSVLLAAVGLVALALSSTAVGGDARPTTSPFSGAAALSTLLRAPLHVVARDPSLRASRLTGSRPAGAHGAIPFGILAMLALLSGHRTTSVAITGQGWRWSTRGRHSRWLRGPPNLA